MSTPRFLGEPDPPGGVLSPSDKPSKLEATGKLAAVLASGGGASALTTPLAAAFLGVHLNTLKRAADGPPYYVINTRGDRRYRLADLIAWQEARLSSSTPVATIAHPTEE